MADNTENQAIKSSRAGSIRRTTLSDVAREAGVSAVAVSVVINGTKTGTRVSEASRRRIVEAAQRLRYSPNQAARSLARGKSKVIGLVLGNIRPLSGGTHDLGNEYTLFVIEGITAACGERGYHMFIFTNPWRENAETLEIFRDRRTDGLILLVPPSDTQILSELRTVGVRFVSIGHPATGLGATSVDVDDALGARLAMEHLLSLGHRKIAHIHGSHNASSVMKRLEIYRAVLAEQGIPHRPDYELNGYPGAESDYKVTPDSIRHLLTVPDPPTAVFACDDTIAVKLLDVAAKMGISVPSQLSVVGFDDRPMASIVTPALTTIRQPMVQIGYQAACALIQELEAEEGNGPPPASQTIRMIPELIVRQSSAPVSE